MSFYNPYMQRPDYGQGINDFVSQMFQMMMYKKYMDAIGRGEEQGQPQESAMPETLGPQTPPMPNQGYGTPQSQQTMVDPYSGEINPWAWNMARSPEDQQALMRYWWSRSGGMVPKNPHAFTLGRQ